MDQENFEYQISVNIDKIDIVDENLKTTNILKAGIPINERELDLYVIIYDVNNSKKLKVIQDKIKIKKNVITQKKLFINLPKDYYNFYFIAIDENISIDLENNILSLNDQQLKDVNSQYLCEVWGKKLTKCLYPDNIGNIWLDRLNSCFEINIEIDPQTFLIFHPYQIDMVYEIDLLNNYDYISGVSNEKIKTFINVPLGSNKEKYNVTYNIFTFSSKKYSKIKFYSKFRYKHNLLSRVIELEDEINYKNILPNHKYTINIPIRPTL